MNTFENVKKRYSNANANSIQKVIKRSHVDPRSGVVEYFVVKKKRGCWLSIETVDPASLVLERSKRSKQSREKWQQRLNEKLEGESLQKHLQKNFDRVLHAHQKDVKSLMITCRSKGLQAVPADLIKPVRDRHLNEIISKFRESNRTLPPVSTLIGKLDQAERDVSKTFYESQRNGIFNGM